MTAKQIAIVILWVLAGTIFAFLLNFFILDKILIPDPCYYHSHDTTKLFDIFYELTSSEGYHPFPTKFNFIFTATIGAIFGLTLSIYKLRKYDEREQRTANIGLAIWRLKCFYGTFVQSSTAVNILNFCAKNPPHRQAEKRKVQAGLT